MKKTILIVSDSHGYNSHVEDAIVRAREKYGKIDMMFHAGDVGSDWREVETMLGMPTYIVAGNNDFDRKLLKTVAITVGDHRILMTHGHRYGVHYGVENIRYLALENDCDIAIYGHTHEPYLEEDGDVIIINPGSLTYPRQSDRRRTFAVMTIEDDEIKVEFDDID